MSTKTSTLTSPRDVPSTVPIRRVAPHRRYAKKFLALPDELLTKISDAVAPEDLPNFRLTCKTLANISAKHFGEKRLAHRRFILTEYSLKGLVEMTAHPVFGSCVKSVLFGTDHLTNQLVDLMDALDSHKITDPTKAMRVLQIYRERCAKWFEFSKSQELSRMLQTALSNLSSQGTNVSLGIFNDARESRRGKPEKIVLRGYGSTHDYGGLPFTRFMTLNQTTLRIIRRACRVTNFRPELFELDLRGQETHDGMTHALTELLLTNGELRSNFDVCIREGDMDIRILKSQNCLELKQRPVRNQMLSIPEYVRFCLYSLGQPMLVALISASFTQLHMESCSMWSGQFVGLLKALDETLKVVKLVDVALWGDQCNLRNMEPVLHCLRHELQLTTLVLDDVRAMNKDYSGDSGILLAKGRFWHGQQQICEGLDVLAGFDGYGWDDMDLNDSFERGSDNESDLQSMNYSQYDDDMTYEEFLEYKAREEERIEDQRREYKEYKVTRARAEEAMARVEAREFNS
ncbi:hypothetical protein KCV07_g6192, partial [Aureobasidium melanogenum]